MAGRANWVNGSLGFVTHWSVGVEKHYLTPLPDLLPFFHACVPLSPPPTFPLKSKDPQTQKDVQIEEGGTGSWGWG